MQTTYILNVYRAPSGQLAARLLDGDIEVMAIAGCATLQEVEEAVSDAGYGAYALVTALPIE